MPIYSHECECGKSIVDNIYRSYDECPKTFKADCSACGKKKVKFKKVISGGGSFRIQGGGVCNPTSKFD